MPITGIDLVFVTYPAILSTMHYPNFWVGFFFVTTIFIGIDSQFGMVECAAYFLEDLRLTMKVCGSKVKIKGVKARAIVCGALFMGGLPMVFEGTHTFFNYNIGGLYIFNTFDEYSFRISASVANLMNII